MGGSETDSEGVDPPGAGSAGKARSSGATVSLRGRLKSEPEGAAWHACLPLFKLMEGRLPLAADKRGTGGEPR